MFNKGKPVASHECAKCQGGCCRESPSVVFINFHEIKRIQEATGLPASFFAHYAKVRKDFLKDFKAAQGELLLGPGNKTTLLRFVAGKCVFLTKYGCSLPKELKTVVCRTFPLWYWHFSHGKNKLYFPENMDACPLAMKFKDEKNFDPLIKEMNETRAGLYRLFRRYDLENSDYIRYKHWLEYRRLDNVIDRLAILKYI
jgi:Fe-S-cluster containining protein